MEKKLSKPDCLKTGPCFLLSDWRQEGVNRKASRFCSPWRAWGKRLRGLRLRGGTLSLKLCELN